MWLDVCVGLFEVIGSVTTLYTHTGHCNGCALIERGALARVDMVMAVAVFDVSAQRAFVATLFVAKLKRH